MLHTPEMMIRSASALSVIARSGWNSEPLKVESQHFVDCITKGVQPRSSGEQGLEVVRVLEAADESIREDGRMIAIEPIGSTAPGRE